MNSYFINNAEQKQRVLYQNYRQGPITSSTQALINNPNQLIQQYDSPQLGSMYQIPGVYNQVNIMPPPINIANQQQNIRVLPTNQNINIIQKKYLNQNTSNRIYNQSRMINTNSIKNNVIDHEEIFEKCFKLSKFPNIFK